MTKKKSSGRASASTTPSKSTALWFAHDYATLAVQCRDGKATNTSRSKVWKVLFGYDDFTGTDRLEAQQREKKYKVLLLHHCSLMDGVNVAEEEPTAIDRDIARTKKSLQFFAGGKDYSSRQPSDFSAPQQALRRVLHTADASLSTGKECRWYFQGVNEIAAQLLVVFTDSRLSRLNTSVEADVFWCTSILTRQLMDPSGLPLSIKYFRVLLDDVSGEVWRHLKTLDAGLVDGLAVRWFTALFSYEFDSSSLLRVWDFLFSFGKYVKVAAAYVGTAMCIRAKRPLLDTVSIEDAWPLLSTKRDLEMTENILTFASTLMTSVPFSKLEKLVVATS